MAKNLSPWWWTIKDLRGRMWRLNENKFLEFMKGRKRINLRSIINSKLPTDDICSFFADYILVGSSNRKLWSSWIWHEEENSSALKEFLNEEVDKIEKSHEKI